MERLKRLTASKTDQNFPARTRIAASKNAGIGQRNKFYFSFIDAEIYFAALPALIRLAKMR